MQQKKSSNCTIQHKAFPWNFYLLLATFYLVTKKTDRLHSHLFERHLNDGYGRKEFTVDRVTMETCKLIVRSEFQTMTVKITHQYIYEHMGSKEESIHLRTDGENMVEHRRNFLPIVLDRQFSIQFTVEGHICLLQGITISLYTLLYGITAGINTLYRYMASTTPNHSGYYLVRAFPIARHHNTSLPLRLQLVDCHHRKIIG